MRLKAGVNCKDVHSKIWEALWIVEVIYIEHGQSELTVTSMRDAKHSKVRSAHYRGEAADLRIWGFSKAELRNLVEEIKARLGDDYVVVLEHNHIHIHWSPIYKEGD